MTRDGKVFSNVLIPEHVGKDMVVIASPAGEHMRKEGIVAEFRSVLAGMGYPGPATKLDEL